MFKSIRVGASKKAIHVIGAFAGAKRASASEAALSKGVRDRAATIRKSAWFDASAGEVAPIDEQHILLGLGERADLNSDTARRIGAGLVRALDRAPVAAIDLAIGDAVSAAGLDARDAGRALAEGIGLANWRFDRFDGKVSKRRAAHPPLTVVVRDRAFAKGVREGLVRAEATNYARGLAATPPNVCTPRFLASQARKLARSSELTCRVITHQQAQQQGMGGIVNVGKGSTNKPCLIVLEHKPARARANKTIALVGKSITFDTGGYSLKISGTMKGMKYDKNGGMAVLGAMRAISALKLPVRVVALLPAAENMISDSAYRVDDIITMYNGATVEVTNTDAEGRLVLADALAYACRKYKLTAILDAATLTGGVVVALGFWSAGLFCNDDDLRRRVQQAADQTGERVWRLPLWKDHADFMRAKHADLWNSAPKRDGHPIQGAAFLSHFVDEEVPWAHLDIAGVSKIDSADDVFGEGPTGFGVRLMTDVVASYA